MKEKVYEEDRVQGGTIGSHAMSYEFWLMHLAIKKLSSHKISLILNQSRFCPPSPLNYIFTISPRLEMTS